MIAFYATSFVIWLALGVIWKKSDWLNTLIKISLFLMAAWAWLYVYEALLALEEAK